MLLVLLLKVKLLCIILCSWCVCVRCSLVGWYRVCCLVVSLNMLIVVCCCMCLGCVVNFVIEYYLGIVWCGWFIMWKIFLLRLIMSNEIFFSKIICCEILVIIVYEDDEVLGFKDIVL